jgi:hypothetical protein
VLIVISFASTVVAHQTLSQVFTGNSSLYASIEEAVSAYSSFWLNALVPTNRPVAASLALSASVRG